MRKNRLMQFMVTTEQHDRIRNITYAKGFLHMSDYLRYSALEQDLEFEIKFAAIYRAVMTLLETIKK